MLFSPITRPLVAERNCQSIWCRPMNPMCRSFSLIRAQCMSVSRWASIRSKKATSCRRLTPQLRSSRFVISGSFIQRRAFSRWSDASDGTRRTRSPRSPTISMQVLSGKARALLDEGQAVATQSDPVGEEVAPDARRRGQGGQGASEGLDRHVAIVSARLQARPERVPVHLAGAGNAPVVFRDVDVDRLGRARGD